MHARFSIRAKQWHNLSFVFHRLKIDFTFEWYRKKKFDTRVYIFRTRSFNFSRTRRNHIKNIIRHKTVWLTSFFLLFLWVSAFKTIRANEFATVSLSLFLSSATSLHCVFRFCYLNVYFDTTLSSQTWRSLPDRFSLITALINEPSKHARPTSIFFS